MAAIIAGAVCYMLGAASVYSHHRASVTSDTAAGAVDLAQLAASITSDTAADTVNLAQPVTTGAASSASLLGGETLRLLLENSAASAPGDPLAADDDPREAWAEWDARELWAKIEVNGEVVARVYRSGGCSIDADWPVPADFAWDQEGIELAKRRAYQLAKAYGGTINGIDPDRARHSWLDMSELESAIGNTAAEDQSPTVQLAVPTEAFTPSLAA